MSSSSTSSHLAPSISESCVQKMVVMSSLVKMPWSIGKGMFIPKARVILWGMISLKWFTTHLIQILEILSPNQILIEVVPFLSTKHFTLDDYVELLFILCYVHWVHAMHFLPCSYHSSNFMGEHPHLECQCFHAAHTILH